MAQGVVHIQATFNNTIVTVTDKTGDTICWGSAAQPASRATARARPSLRALPRRTPYRLATDNGMQEVDVFVKGPGPGREAAVRALQGTGLRVRSITDVTPVPHNGCRRPRTPPRLI